ncbi:MAG: signal peptidase II [Eubacterium sp.]|nr:signal peptidase II [Eubacterium sp.]MCM1213492.1 signal peptidase II [Lachnospiraceae bacterium]MCM1305015.1 signal peptidase II [Butyrivibrio sp.]MCM1344102.1 signal peptidase II [Muribaculaceae bacterium]MCM1240898.1 signal peptidase II [Lachnospiraceae bacterium]
MAVSICVISALGIFFGDLWIKGRIEKTGGENFPACFAGKKLILKKYHNTGAMLDMGSSKRAVVAAISALLTILVGIAFVLSLGQRGNHTLRAGLTLLLGGSFSNTYDRLKRKYVVDYLSFNVKWKWFRNIVFNLSDFCIMTGALLTALALAR